MLFSRSTHIGLRSSLNCPNKKMFFFKNKDAYGYSTLRSRKKPTDESKTTTVVHTNSKRRPLRALFLTTIGALLMVSIKDYQSYAQYDDADPLVRPTSWPLYLYSYLPLNTLSRLWGSFNDLTLPISIRASGYRLYSFLFGVNLDEMQDPDLTHYKNLGEFFYRKIKPETRPIDPLALLVSPSDGKVLKFGKVDEDGGIEQVKGMTYNLNALLGSHGSKQISKSDYLIYDENNEDHHQDFLNHLQNNTNYDCSARSNNVLDDQSLAVISEQGEKSILHPSTSKIFKASKALIPSTDSKKTNLFYAVIYLAPGDYHRFHSPVTWVTTLRRHFVGQLYSVAPYFQHTFNNLFVLNERVALLGYWKYGFFSMTPVGATNVGSIKINFDKDLVTNKSVLQTGERVKKNTCYEAHYSNASSLLHGHPLLKGEEVGGFKLGSTVVLVFEAPENFKFTLQENQYVKMGQGIGELEE